MFMDLAELRDTANPLPSSIPDDEQFRRNCGALGVGDDSHVVNCDDSPHATAARAWFGLRHFGFDNASILDGGIGNWRAEGRPLEAGPAERAGGGLSPVPERRDVRTLADVRANLDSKAELVVDARGPARFSGEEAETRPGLASGHIPGAINLPYGKLLNADGTWKRGGALRQAFTAAGVDLSRPIVTRFGSGITASVLPFGLSLPRKHDFALYHGPWSGEEAETRPGLASGHRPGAINLPYGKLLNADGTWKRGDALRQAFTDAGVDLSRPIVTSCGSGITASVLLFGLYLLGKHDFALYDGSWTEWGGDPSTPKATGHA